MIDLTQFEGHTPGPWKISNRNSGFSYRLINVSDGAYITVCAKNHEKNSTLVAAAPDLLAEVERLRKLLDIAYKALEETSWNELASQLHHRPACKAIVAIDAAEGE